jgi:hypothetical protein
MFEQYSLVDFTDLLGNLAYVIWDVRAPGRMTETRKFNV